MQPELIEKIKDIDLSKVGKKAILVVSGLLFGAIGLVLLNKFVEDNFDFRVDRISNKPPNDKK